MKYRIHCVLLAAVGAALATGCEVEQTREGKLPDVSVDADTGAIPDYDVRKTRDGELPDVDIDVKAGKMPAYEIEKKRDGRLPNVDVDVEGGQMPAYDVKVPSVTVGEKQVAVKVPTGVDIKTEEKTVTVPTLDVDLPKDEDQ